MILTESVSHYDMNDPNTVKFERELCSYVAEGYAIDYFNAIWDDNHGCWRIIAALHYREDDKSNGR